MAALTREGTYGKSRDRVFGRVHYGDQGAFSRQMTCQSVQYWLTVEERKQARGTVLKHEDPLCGQRWGSLTTVAQQVKIATVSGSFEENDDLQDRSNQLTDLLAHPTICPTQSPWQYIWHTIL